MGGIPVLAAVSAPSSVARSNAPPKISSFGTGRARPWTPLNQFNQARAKIPIRDVDVVSGTGTAWGAAVDNIAWQSGDMLLLGSGAAGPKPRCSRFGGIKDSAPCTVPVMIEPRHRMPTSDDHLARHAGEAAHRRWW